MNQAELTSPPKAIERNRFLHGAGKAIKLDEFLMLLQVAKLGDEKLGRQINLAVLSESLVHRVNAVYGGEGLFQLTMLAMAHERREFEHFIEPLEWILAIEEMAKTQEPEAISYDNHALRQSATLAQFNTNVLQPSLSRKLYRAGRHHGSLVYGLGGPRILVSHPFQGRTEDIYDLYANSIDVVTSLCLRGYRGTFHLLDYLPGLNPEIEGVPGWSLWFSIIAIHSDLILFVREYGGDFQWAQRLEIEMTPDRVRKKIVSIPHDELKWTKKIDGPAGHKSICLGERGLMNEEDWLKMEAEHAMPFIQNYMRPGIPRDRLIQIGESGGVKEFPLDYPAYSSPA